MARSVCFVWDSVSDCRLYDDISVLYRCYFRSECLGLNGYRCNVYSATEFYSIPSFDYDAYVFLHPNAKREGFSTVFEYLRQQGRVLIADYDNMAMLEPRRGTDAASDLDTISLTNLKLQGWCKGADEALRRFDLITASTQGIAAAINTLQSSAVVSVSPNCIAPSHLSLHCELGTPFRRRANSTIGYIPSGDERRDCLDGIGWIIERVLSENHGSTLMVSSSVNLPDAIKGHAGVTIVPEVDEAFKPSLRAMCSTLILPSCGTHLDKYRSRRGVFDAFLSGAQLVCASIPDFAMFHEHVTFADSADAWYGALSQAAAESVSAYRDADLVAELLSPGIASRFLCHDANGVTL